MNQIKALIIGDVPSIFVANFESVFYSRNTYFIDLEKQPSGDEFSIRFYFLQPDFIMIALKNYLRHQEFYDKLMKSFPNLIFWKIDTDKVWRLEDIKKALKEFRSEFLKKR